MGSQLEPPWGKEILVPLSSTSHLMGGGDAWACPCYLAGTSPGRPRRPGLGPHSPGMGIWNQHNCQIRALPLCLGCPAHQNALPLLCSTLLPSSPCPENPSYWLNLASMRAVYLCQSSVRQAQCCWQCQPSTTRACTKVPCDTFTTVQGRRNTPVLTLQGCWIVPYD